MIKERLNQLRTKMHENDLDVYYLNTQDYHMSEYIPEYFKTLRYFSGFTGSMATLVVSLEEAIIFVDGRYHQQAEKECEPYGLSVMKLGTKGAITSEAYLKTRCQGMTIGLDGRCVDAGLVKRLKDEGLDIKSIDIYSDIYADRPRLTSDALYELDVKYTGFTRAQKLDMLRRIFAKRVHVLTDLVSIAYVLNLRGNDIAYTPVFMSYMVFDDEDVYLFIDKSRLSDVLLEGLFRDGVIVKEYDDFYDYLKTIKNKDILLDENKVNWKAYSNLDKSNRLINMRSVIEEMRSIKNTVEIKNAIQAHIWDGVAMVRFMKWLKESDMEGLRESDVKRKLNRFRLEYKAFDLSFNAIVAYGANAAMMHYSPEEGADAELKNEGIILVDSGGQYLEGTTDITRTFALGPVSDKIKRHFSLVLRSMLNLQDLRFLSGLSGNQLDIVARKDLWHEGIDYRCGTGHGVGQVLSVHDALPRVVYSITADSSEVLRPGQIFSDEPGVYLPGEYGIRCENLLLCKEVEKNEYGIFLGFEAITLVPFDLDLIDKETLGEDGVRLLNAYHSKVYDTLAPYLDEEEKAYLQKATKAI